MADDRHPQCVLVAEELKTAAALADWLTEKGYPAEVVTPGPIADTGDSLGLTEAAGAGIEVRVVKQEHIEPAKKAIDEQREALAELRARQERRANRTGTAKAVCDDCGKESEWPAAAMGSTQDCPHCGAYIDVPDPDENWDDVDFTAEEGEDAEAGEEGEPKREPE